MKKFICPIVISCIIFVFCLCGCNYKAIGEMAFNYHVEIVNKLNAQLFNEFLHIDKFTESQARLFGGYKILYQNNLKKGESAQNIFESLSKGFFAKLNTAVLCAEVQAENAQVNFDVSGGPSFTYARERVGNLINRKKLYEDIFNYIDGKQSTPIVAEYFTELPKINLKQVKNSTKLISASQTEYASSSVNRKQNIKIATEAISGTVVEGGGSFSFNTIVGKRTEQRGYLKANTIINGEYFEDYGGGVCQVATTVYNALIKAGLKVLTRTHHSIPPSYVPLSQDAMVSGQTDLIMQNPYSQPVYIYCKATDSSLKVMVFSTQTEFEIRLKSTIKKAIEPKEVVILDSENKYNLAQGQSLEIKKARVGYVSFLTVQYYKNNLLVKEVSCSEDFYKPADKVTAIPPLI